MIAHINIGSNQGNREAYIARAVALLGTVGEVVSVSSPLCSAPWGYNSESEFLNIGVNLRTGFPPEELLSHLKAIERKIAPDGEHRDSDGCYQDRQIDLDLIAYGDLCFESDTLTVPHPHMHLRRYVLEPMGELLPQWRHPKSGLSCKEMLMEIQ